MKRFLILILLTTIPFSTGAQVMRYDREAASFNEALPLGNGHIGAMVYGGVDDDLINLNTTYGYIPGTGMVANGTYENVDKATIQGLEVETKQKLGNFFTLRGTYTYLDARDDNTNALLTGRARHKTSLQLIYSDAKNGWDATLWNDWLSGYEYTSSKSSGDTGASIMNIVVNKKVNDQLSAYFGVNNLTDVSNDVVYYEGRIWRGGLKYTF